MSGGNLSNWLVQNGVGEYQTVVSHHWLSQRAPDPQLVQVIGIIFCLFCLMNNVCAILLFFVYWRNHKLRTNSNRLLMSLTVADFILMSGGYIIVAQSIIGYPMLGPRGCNISGFIGTLGSLAEIWSLTAIALDRLKAVYHPLERKKRFNGKDVTCIICSIWFLSLVFALSPLLGWNRYVSEAFVIGCSFDSFSPSWSDRSYILVLVILAWFIPMCVLSGCYLRIFYAVRGGLLQWGEIPNVAEEQRRRMERTLAKMVSFLLLLWCASWTPYTVMSLWTMFVKAQGLTPTWALFPTIFCKLSATMNGFIYGVRLPKFEKEIKKILHCCGANQPSHSHRLLSIRAKTNSPRNNSKNGGVNSQDINGRSLKNNPLTSSSSGCDVTIGKTVETRNTTFSTPASRSSSKKQFKRLWFRPRRKTKRSLEAAPALRMNCDHLAHRLTVIEKSKPERSRPFQNGTNESRIMVI